MGKHITVVHKDAKDGRTKKTRSKKVRVKLIKFRWGGSYLGCKPFKDTPMR